MKISILFLLIGGMCIGPCALADVSSSAGTRQQPENDVRNGYEISPPAITVQPSNATVDPGDNAVFGIRATGNRLRYRWKKDGEYIKDHGNIFGSQTSTLKLVGVAQEESGEYSVEIENEKGTITSSSAKLIVRSATVFFDDFESRTTNWISFTQGLDLSVSSNRNVTLNGFKSLQISESRERFFHNLGTKLVGKARVTFWIYDDGTPDLRCFGELRGHTGRGHGKYSPPGGMKQLFAIGCFPDQSLVKNSGSITNEQPSILKYQARVLRGQNTGWFNLDEAPDRSAGWHKFEIERDSDGTTVHFYVDGVLGRTITDADHVALDCVVIGSSGTGNASVNASFDDIKVESFPRKYDWRTKDSDGKGLFDWMKLRETGTEFSATNIVSINTMAELPGSSAVRTLGKWEIEGAGIYAVDRRGYVEYTVNLPEDDAYRIEIEGRERKRKMPVVELPLIVSIDGEDLGRFPLRYSGSENGLLHCFTPYLKSGVHTIRIYWDGSAGRQSLYLHAVRWQTLSGADENNNGIKDWVENRVLSQSGLDAVPKTSKTSPVCIEGLGQHLSLIELSVPLHDEEQSVFIHPSAADRWYADVPLSPSGPTKISVTYESGVLEETAEITWEPVNLLNEKDLVIRKGDALLLTAAPEGTSNGSVTVNIEGITNYVSGVSVPVVHRFNESGTFAVKGTFVPTGLSGTIQIKVVEASFDSLVAAWVGKRRFWDCTNLPPEAVIEADPRLKFVEVAKTERDRQIPKPPPLGVNGRQYSVTIDEIGTRIVLARLGENGPILASAPIVGFRLFNGAETYLRKVETLEDGSELIETAVILSPALPDVNVRLQILVSGVTFADGTISKALVFSDFDELGQCPVQFIRGAGVQTSVCHSTKAYQNRNLIGWPGNPK